MFVITGTEYCSEVRILLDIFIACDRPQIREGVNQGDEWMAYYGRTAEVKAKVLDSQGKIPDFHEDGKLK
jgi:hypothetical protein